MGEKTCQKDSIRSTNVEHLRVFLSDYPFKLAAARSRLSRRIDRVKKKGLMFMSSNFGSQIPSQRTEIFHSLLPFHMETEIFQICARISLDDDNKTNYNYS